MLKPLTVAVAEFPAASNTVPVALRFEPFAETVTGLGQAAAGIPDRASEHVNVTVTGPTYQPLLPFVPLVIAPMMVGGVLSSFTVAESVPGLPAVSFAEPLTTWPLVSCETVAGFV